MQKRLAVIYLARMAEGLAPLQRFVESYRRHPAEVPHELVVLYKGFEYARQLKAAKEVFAATPHKGIEVPDVGYDIGAYLSVLPQIEHDLICCMNTFAEPAIDGWLAYLYRAAEQANVGLVGPMGSYESLFDSMGMIQKIVWMCNEGRIQYDERLVYYFGFLIRVACKTWLAQGTSPWWNPPDPWIKILYRWLRRLPRQVRLRLFYPNLSVEERRERHWAAIVAPNGPLADYARFPVFPNPHIRSNGFMIDRRRLLSMGFGPIKSKLDACAFESGADGLTSRLRRERLRTLVVSGGGQSFDVGDWVHSNTFRARENESLLITDNQVRQFHEMDPGARLAHLRMTWGDYLLPAPDGFPELGFKFAVSPDLQARDAS